MPIKDIEERRAYARKWVAGRRAVYFAGKKCSECGSSSDLELLRKDTKATKKAIWSFSPKSRAREIKGCVILCAACRKEKVMAENRVRFTKPLVHGTAVGYEKKGCRCDLCREAIRIMRANRLGRNKAKAKGRK